jgi:putative DNA primase/helicase
VIVSALHTPHDTLEIEAAVKGHISDETITARDSVQVPSEAGSTDEPRQPKTNTDTGNAQRLLAAHGSDLRYCHPWGSWLCWRGTHWQTDDIGTVMRLAKQTMRGLLEWATKALADEAIEDDRKPAIKATAAWALKSLDARRLKAMTELARCEVPILPGDMDRENMLLNVRNGTINLRTGKLHEHRKDDYITKLCPVVFDPNATCKTWERCMDRWQGGNADIVGYLQRSVGYSLTGDVSEQCLYFLHGGGNNGKSKFLGAILDILGDYGRQSIAELLMQRHGESHPTERADLQGRRFVCTIETEDGRRMAEALVKQLTGGDKITARRMRQDFWEFEPTHKLWLAANHKPKVKGTDYAIWRRIKVVPFTVTIPPEERDPHIGDKLKAEAHGILAWAVRGCMEWQQIGLAEPEEVTRATDAYRSEQDTVGEFIREQCQSHPDLRCLAKFLHNAYQAWSGDRSMSLREFGDRLRSLGLESKRGNTGYVWHGIGLPSGSEPGEPSAY